VVLALVLELGGDEGGVTVSRRPRSGDATLGSAEKLPHRAQVVRTEAAKEAVGEDVAVRRSALPESRLGDRLAASETVGAGVGREVGEGLRKSAGLFDEESVLWAGRCQ
jgi:hypothetical protein